MAKATEKEMKDYFSRMSARDLRAYARRNGMSTITKLTRKAELVNAIVAYLLKKS